MLSTIESTLFIDEVPELMAFITFCESLSNSTLSHHRDKASFTTIRIARASYASIENRPGTFLPNPKVTDILSTIEPTLFINGVPELMAFITFCESLSNSTLFHPWDKTSFITIKIARA